MDSDDAVQPSSDLPLLLDRPEPGIARITLCRPDRMNTADHDLVTRFRAALDEIEADLAIRVVIVTGQGRAFCAGLNLAGYGDDELVAQQGALPRTMARQKEIASLVARIRGLRVPVVTAVNGADRKSVV